MEIEIYDAELSKVDENWSFIHWRGNIGFGSTKITHKGQGVYEIDSEALSLETVIKIIQKVKL